MLICALFGMPELNAWNIRTSELRALNIEYFCCVRGEACDSSFIYNYYDSFGISKFLYIYNDIYNITTIIIGIYNNNFYHKRRREYCYSTIGIAIHTLSSQNNSELMIARRDMVDAKQ